MRLKYGSAIKMKALGYTNGTPDLLIFEPKIENVHFDVDNDGKIVCNFDCYCGLFLEVKAPDGRPSKDQLEFKKRLELNKNKHAFVYSLDEAKKIIDEYLGA